MTKPPQPRDEARRVRRLKALRVLDTAPEAFSDSVVVAAATIANTPIAAVSLIDTDRQWFKGTCGLDTRETPRDISFCAHAIVGTAPLIVLDASLDERFSDNPLVTGEPHIRFYAGFPLEVEGQIVGVLCIIDDRARSLTAGQVARLGALAASTAAWLTTYRTPGQGH